jgi:hypothetical protein
VAALTPDDWDVHLVDENVEPVDLDAPADVVGIAAMNVQAARAFELCDAFRRRGRTVVMGGPFATLQPERCAPHVSGRASAPGRASAASTPPGRTRAATWRPIRWT